MKNKVLIILFFCTSLNAKMITPEELGVVFDNYFFEANPSYINTSNIIRLYTKESFCELVITDVNLTMGKNIVKENFHSTKTCEEVAKIINK